MKVKISEAALNKLVSKQTKQAEDGINRRAAGKSPSQLERIAKEELRKAGLEPNFAGVKKIAKEIADKQ
ncbi:hypothetical protein SAMN04488565_2919 [Leucobacter chromiiresistens]|uniref:Uncharacterized protein n=2 Tax=Leucobacter chromiiresistens TaxID=1079994 RepID=A0A1H1BMD0_9MICO|nr:hypothetical protein SAMN04488565_2919 [Leucobacter chromiiresistens]